MLAYMFVCLVGVIHYLCNCLRPPIVLHGLEFQKWSFLLCCVNISLKRSNLVNHFMLDRWHQCFLKRWSLDLFVRSMIVVVRYTDLESLSWKILTSKGLESLFCICDILYSPRAKCNSNRFQNSRIKLFTMPCLPGFILSSVGYSIVFCGCNFGK